MCQREGSEGRRPGKVFRGRGERGGGGGKYIRVRGGNGGGNKVVVS